jgi:hypothetical protein
MVSNTDWAKRRLYLLLKVFWLNFASAVLLNFLCSFNYLCPKSVLNPQDYPKFMLVPKFMPVIEVSLGCGSARVSQPKLNELSTG